MMDFPVDKASKKRKTHRYKFGTDSTYASAWDAFMARRKDKPKKRKKKNGVLTK